jgi:hypothetical protein
MFEKGGHAGMLFRYHGPDTGNRWAVMRAGGRRAGFRPTYHAGLFRENAFYFGQKKSLPELEWPQTEHGSLAPHSELPQHRQKMVWI